MVGRRQRRLAAVAVIAVLVAAAALPANARAMGQVHCAGSHASLIGTGDARSVGDMQVDPIAERGAPASMHLHEFFGSTAILGLAHPELASYTDLVSTPTSCDILADSALYWFPLLTQNGVPVPLSRMEAYYMAWDGALTDTSGATRELPPDLRMIAGNMMAASSLDMDLKHVHWDCGANSTKPGSKYWFATPADADCATAGGNVVLTLAVTFPSCWDGKLNDHTVLGDTSDYTGNMMSTAVRHLAYPTSTGCPSAFPIKLMTLRENISWAYAGDGTDVTLSSGPGYTAHADFLNSWVPSGMTAMLSHCIDTSLTDAQTHTRYPGICGPPLSNPLASITVSPSQATIVAGGSQTYRVEGFDKLGNDIGDETGVTRFSIDGSGSCAGATCSATDPGTYTVTATTTDGAATATAQLRVVAAPTVTGYLAPPVLQKSPFVVSFSRAVMGVSTSDFTVVEVGASSPLAGAVACLNASNAVVSCSSGPVSVARFTPSSALIAGEYYYVNINPSSMGVVGYPDGVAAATWQGYVRAQTLFSDQQYPVRYAWGTVANAAALGGSYVQELNPNASEKFSFSGTSLALVMWGGPDRGTATVTITSTGATKITQQINTYAASPGDVTFSWPTLVSGSHTVTVMVNGANVAPSTNTWVSIDAVTENGSTIVTPALTGMWSDGGGYPYVFTGQKGASVTLVFRGTGVTWDTLVGPNEGKAAVRVDGALITTQDLYAAGSAYQDFTYAGLTDTLHTLRITALGTKQPASSDTIITNHTLTVL